MYISVYLFQVSLEPCLWTPIWALRAQFSFMAILSSKSSLPGIYLSIYLSRNIPDIENWYSKMIYLSIYLSIYLGTSPTWRTGTVRWSFYLSIYLSRNIPGMENWYSKMIYLSIYLSKNIPDMKNWYSKVIFLSIYLSIYLGTSQT